MAQGTRSYKIDRLTDTNFQPWKTKMTMILQTQDLMGIVDGTSVCPAPAAPTHADWLAKDLKARLEMLLHMEDAQTQAVRTLTTAKAIWDYLIATYERKNKASQVNLYKKLNSLIMEEDGEADKFIRLWRLAMDDLIISGLVLPDEFQAVLLVAALPPSWQPFITTKTNVPNLTLPILIPSILEEYEMRRTVVPTTSTTSTNIAMLSRDIPSRGRQFGPSSSRPPPHGASSSNWRSRSSPHFSSRSNRQSTSRHPFRFPKPYCNRCKVTGHDDRSCWKQHGRSRRNHANYVANSTSDEESDLDVIDTSSQSSQEDIFLCLMATHISQSLPYNIPSTSWILDTGATCNLTSSRHDLRNYKPLTKPFEVRFGNNGTQQALGVGTAHIMLSDGNVVAVDKVYYVPHIAKNLISVSQIAQTGTKVEFGANHCTIKHKLPGGGQYAVLGPKIGKLYLLGHTKTSEECHSASLTPNPDYSTLLWHYRLGHLNLAMMQTIATHNLVHHYSLPKKSRLDLCEGCIYGKLANQKYPSSRTSTSHPLELVHSDLCGPLPVISLSQHNYFITFIDDFTKYTLVAFIPNKTGHIVLKAFQSYHSIVTTHIGLPLRALQTDNGGEYTSHIFQSYCQQHGIRQRLTVPHNPQQNGIAERKNRSLMNMARSMLKIAGLPSSFWEEAVATSCYLQNRVYTRSIKAIPYTLWYGQKPDYASLRIFGCTAYAHVPPSQRHKLGDHAIKALFVGYGEPYGIKGYRLYDTTKRKFFYSRSLIFDEDSLLSAGPRSAAFPESVAESTSSSSRIVTPSTRSWRAPPDPAPVAAPAPAAPPAPALAPNLPLIPVVAPIVQPITPTVPSRTPTNHGNARHTRSFTHLDYGDTIVVGTSKPSWDPTGPHSMRQVSPTGVGSSSLPSRKKTKYKQLAIEWDRDFTPPPNEPQPVSSTDHPPPFDCPNTWPTLPNASPSSPLSSPSPQPQQRTRSLAEIYQDTEPSSNADNFTGSAFTLPESHDVDTSDPLSVEDALAGPHAQQWRQAMQDELGSLQKNKTWSLVPLPPARKPISCKWVLRRKLHPDGSVARYKARLVARGFSQVAGLDYGDTFSPVLRMSSFRLLLALAAALDLELFHLDVQTAFLHGELPDELYMEQPPYFVSETAPRSVCRLHRSLYGLKQSPRLWFHKFNEFMLSHGYHRLNSEPNVYTRHSHDSILIVALYVDDISMLGSTNAVIDHAVRELQSAFPITVLGNLTYFLGLQIMRDRTNQTLIVHQSSYIDSMLKEFGFSHIKSAVSPLPITCKLTLKDCPTNIHEKEFMSQFPFRPLIGKMRYLVTGTRPDICYACNFLSRFMHNPGMAHWKSLVRVVRYLKHTTNYGIKFSSQSTSQPIPLLGWSDSDWGGESDTRRSTAGFVFTLAGGAITWQSKRQTSVTLSTAEAEFVAVALAAKGLWLQSVIEELRLIPKPSLKIFCDNMSCIFLASNPKHSEKTKHVDLKYHFIRELVESKKLHLEHTSTQTMWADFLTKSLPADKHKECSEQVGLLRALTAEDALVKGA